MFCSADASFSMLSPRLGAPGIPALSQDRLRSDSAWRSPRHFAFCNCGALQSAQTNESGPEDIAILPLAIPLLTGPGTITSTLLLTAQARGSFTKLAVIVCALALVFLLTRVVIGFGAEHLMSLLRPGGLHVVTRVLGILLAALAVQFVLNGIGEFVRLLEAGRG